MAIKRPGDVLAGRYRLDDLLTESGNGRFWRGYDLVLSRPVAIHVIDADDERAERMMEAARASARIVEPRLLRVLDVENDGTICWVVNEWGKGTSLDHLVAAEGPLTPRRAAWIVDEVAVALETAHEHGVAHGRLNPENVLVDNAGAVRLIGFAVDAALNGLDSDRTGIDIVDLAGLLHFTLTGKWPGLSESAVPRAPREHHGLEYRVLRPRQLRAGVPRVLDDLVDEVLNRTHGRHAGPNTAHEIHELLSAYVGDPAGIADELADTSASVTRTHVRPPDASEASTGESTAVSGGPATGASGTRVEPEATVAGLPAFDTEDGLADLPGPNTDDWFLPRPDVPAPPPPLEPPPERPLFAPAPEDGQPLRRSRSDPSSSGGSDDTGSASYWPFDAPPEEPPVPGRRWLRIGLALGVVLLLVVGGVIAAQLTGDSDDTPEQNGTGSPRPSPTAAASARPIAGVTAADFDPLGDPPAENSDLAPRAVDGDPGTSWRTSTYRQNLGPGGIKSGVGLVLDLRRAHGVTGLEVAFARPGTAFEVYVGTTAPTSADDLGDPAAASPASAGRTARVRLEAPADGRFVTLWLTSLPQVAGGFRTEVAEISVLGTPA